MWSAAPLQSGGGAVGFGGQSQEADSTGGNDLVIISCYFSSQLDPEERAEAGTSPAQSKRGKKLKIKHR